MTTSSQPKPVQLAVPADRDAHRLTTELVRASLLCGVRYGKHGPSREGSR